jgi:hypothetical protein
MSKSEANQPDVASIDTIKKKNGIRAYKAILDLLDKHLKGKVERNSSGGLDDRRADVALQKTANPKMSRKLS